MNLQELASKIEKRFSINELKDLFFQLNINYDDLPGSTRKDKIRELVQFCDRHDRLDEFVNFCKEIRPNESWQSTEQLISLQPSLRRSHLWVIGLVTAALLIFGLIVFAPSLTEIPLTSTSIVHPTKDLTTPSIETMIIGESEDSYKIQVTINNPGEQDLLARQISVKNIGRRLDGCTPSPGMMYRIGSELSIVSSDGETLRFEGEYSTNLEADASFYFPVTGEFTFPDGCGNYGFTLTFNTSLILEKGGFTSFYIIFPKEMEVTSIIGDNPHFDAEIGDIVPVYFRFSRPGCCYQPPRDVESESSVELSLEIFYSESESMVYSMDIEEQ